MVSNRSSENEDQRNVRLIKQREQSATNRLTKREQRKTPGLPFRRQTSEVRPLIRRNQQVLEQNQEINIEHEQLVFEGNQQVLIDNYKWPAAIPTHLKKYCLEDFCKTTSMSVLRQATCIVCNVRASASTMKQYNIEDIPNLEKLSCHPDLVDVIDKITAQSEDLNCEIEFIDMQWFLFIGDESYSIFSPSSSTVLYKKGYSKSAKSGNVCPECHNALNKNKVPVFSVANKMWFGDIPLVLQQLTIAEEKL
jgi:hypothetical protein